MAGTGQPPLTRKVQQEADTPGARKRDAGNVANPLPCPEWPLRRELKAASVMVTP